MKYCLAALTVSALLFAGTPRAQPAPETTAKQGYDQPSQKLLDLLHAPSTPEPVVSPTRDMILLVSQVDYPSIDQVAKPFLKLAGIRLDPANRRKRDTPGGYGIAPCARRYVLVDVATSRETEVALPPQGCVDRPNWAADGKRFVFQNATPSAVELWVAEASTGATRRLGALRLNPMFGDTVQWMADQKSLLVKLVPADAAAPPALVEAVTGPGIQETNGQKGESSTYELRDTLNNSHDEALFEYYGRSQLALIDAASGAATMVGAPGLYSHVDAAGGGKHLLVSTIRKPFSYVTTADNFAHDIEVWDRSGKVLYTVAKLPVADRVPIHGVPTGARAVHWRALEPATLVWAEALDKGDWNVSVPARDKVMMIKAPFTGAPTELVRTEQRFMGFDWGEQRSFALLSERDENRHWVRVFDFNVDEPKTKPRLVWDMSSDELYAHPGVPMARVLPTGELVIAQDKTGAIYLRGEGASASGTRPFIDRFDPKAMTGERLFRSDALAYERGLSLTQQENAFLTWHQSPTEPPNAWVRTIADRVNAGPREAVYASAAKPVTHVPDPTPEVRAIKKRLVKYQRKDGLDLSFTLLTPPNYVEGTRVPTILYAYPLDYADPSKAGQVSASDQVFTRLRNYKMLLMAGYAILDLTAFPVVGDPKRAYDTYLEQLVDDASAAIDKGVEIGVVDRNRVGVTGHSHGALMTVNLVAHSGLFRAGIATSGSYNKTLTPFGFQSERRTVWQSQDVYLKVSPFFFADKIKVPLLIVHGQDDANPGTTPLQAMKLYEAVRGNGGVARLVMLPHEPHWYAAMESNEQLIFEMVRWFDKYVKNAPPPSAAAK